MEAAALLAELFWLVLRALVGLGRMATDPRGLAVILAAALWLWLVDSGATSWLVATGIVLVAGVRVESARAAARQGSRDAAAPAPADAEQAARVPDA